MTVFLAIYAVLLAIFIYVVVSIDSDNTRLMAMYALSTILMLVTIVSAVLLMRNRSNEEIAKRFEEMDREWEEKHQ
ncbi:hypothetical protein TALC_01199 [Thermoplasmatales archaeon BRNA1]|nr:hypothetical protein TALC_01199 [Thermoplasmatales archaeon BRNA1]